MPHPRTGYYAKDGTKLPGTTTICNRFKESGGLLQWAFSVGQSGAESLYAGRDQAGDIGTFVHLTWECFLRGEKLPSIPDSFTEEMGKQASISYEAAQRWLEDSQLEIKPFEQPLVSETYRFGGVPDALATGKRGGALADWKTGSGIYLDTWLQMAAYLQLLAENRPDIDTSDGVHLVRFGKIGEFMHLHIPREHPGLVLAWEQFQALILAFDRDKRLKKLT